MPELSVIMPVYNAGEFLGDAIRSILAQTYTDFELLIINDGSTDNSEATILSFNDPRIVYEKNPVNLGLIATLNKGLTMAKGKYIARMDNDDIAMPERFEVQLRQLKADGEAKLICSPVIGITPGGVLRDHWPADIRTRTSREIRDTLPKENCISHPTILAEAAVIKQYAYSKAQKGSEDWDLWLRMARDGIRMIKTTEVLLKYRIHAGSITQKYNRQRSAQLKSIAVKGRFILASVRSLRVNAFVLKTFFFIFKDLAYHLRKRAFPALARTIYHALSISPLTAYRQFKGLRKTLQARDSRFFLFFPYSHLGGAEKVHARIVKVIEDQRPFVFITGLSDKGGFLAEFGTGAIQIAAALYHPLFSRRAAALIEAKVRSTRDAVVFGANNYFFEELILRIPPQVFVADLTHDIHYAENDALPEYYNDSLMRCDARVFISNHAVEKTLAYYRLNFFDTHFDRRIRVIYNCTPVPVSGTKRFWSAPYRVIYSGRDTPEKAVHRIFSLAARCAEEGLPVEFHMAGEIGKREVPRNMILHGMIADHQKLGSMYGSAHFCIITSLSEGFPMSLAEGMAHGCIPLATAVGDIPYHVRHGATGFIVSSGEERVVEDMLRLLREICAGKYALSEISDQCKNYAGHTFSEDRFRAEYRQLFRLPDRPEAG